MSYLATKGQQVATYDPRWLLRVKQRLPVGLCYPTDWSRCSCGKKNATCERAGRETGDLDYYVFNMAMSLQQASEPPYAPRNTSRASATTTRLCPADQHPRPRVFSHLPAAGNHALPSPASSPAAATYGARAGRAAPIDQKLALCPTHWSPPSTSSGQSSTQGPCRLGRAQQRAEELLLGPESTPSRSKKRPRRIRHPAQISLTGSIDLQHSNTQVNKACCARRAIDKGPGSSAAPVSVSPVAVSGVKPKAVSGVTGRARAGRPGTVSRPSRRSPARLRQPYPKKLATPRTQTTTDCPASQCPP